eukprot:COSAG06_NODE_3596_length_5138_cov_7.213534_4_plen_136_part_00
MQCTSRYHQPYFQDLEYEHTRAAAAFPMPSPRATKSDGTRTDEIILTDCSSRVIATNILRSGGTVARAIIVLATPADVLALHPDSQEEEYPDTLHTEVAKLVQGELLSSSTVREHYCSANIRRATRDLCEAGARS